MLIKQAYLLLTSGKMLMVTVDEAFSRLNRYCAARFVPFSIGATVGKEDN